MEHWHGAKADSRCCHIVVEVPGGETRSERLDPADDEARSKL